MKKHLLLTLLAVLTTALPALAYDFEVDGIYYNILSEGDKTCAVSHNGNGSYTGDIVIPSTVTYDENTYSVTKIGDHAFQGCTNLTTVEIPSTVNAIEAAAFDDCHNLQSVVIPDIVTTIGDWAFADCMSLTSVVIPNTVTSIGIDVFSNCTNLASFTGKFTSDDHRCLIVDGELNSFAPAGLTTYTIPSSVTTIGRSAFQEASSLESVIIPNSVTSIEGFAFYKCTSLKSVEIPSSVTTIVWGAFEECTSLASVEIPKSVTSIGTSAFKNCTSLASVVIPNSVTSIGEKTFFGCTNLTTVEIPNSVTSIGSQAFRECSSLTSVTIPNSVTSIEWGVFEYCTSLASVVIPNTVTSIGDWMFNQCTSLTSVDIPNSVTSIGEQTFRGCANLTSVEIPNSVTSIGYAAFESCSSLTEITSLAVTPPTIQSNTFEGVSKTTTRLTVPNESVEAYKSAEHWSEFESINLTVVTDIAQLSNEKVYTINCARDYLGITSEGKMNAVDNEYASAGDDNLFAIYKGDNGYYLYAIRRGLFVPTQGTTTWSTTVSALDAPDGYYIIEPYSDATYNGFTLTSSTTGCWMMLGGAYQWLGSDTWSTADAGDIWTIAEYDEPLDPETLNTIAAKVKAFEQCAAPTISFVDGKLVVASETPGAVCRTTVTSDDINTFDTNDPIEFTGVYNISAYAHAAGYSDSDPVVATLVWVMPEGDATGLTCMEAKKPVIIRALGGNIVIIGTEKLEKVQLYTIAGVQLASVTADGDQTVIPCSAPKGDVVIVKYGNRSVKIVM